MESRKVQKVGHSTNTISLPKMWVEQNNIKSGDLIFMMPERDGTLKIIPSEIGLKEESEEIIVNTDTCNEKGMVGRIIVGCYILGWDVIRLTSSNQINRENVDEVRRIVRKLIGLGILEETQNQILLQCSVDLSKFKLDMLIRRLSIIASTILSEAMQSFLENDESIAEEAIKRENEADTIYYLALRLLAYAQKKIEISEDLGISDIMFIPAARLILQYLELIADYSEYIAKKVPDFKVYRNKIPNDVIDKITQISDPTKNIFTSAVDCIFSRDLKVANELLEMKSVLEMESDKFMRDAPEIPYLRSIISCLNKIADKGATIAEIAINRAIQNPNKNVENIIKIVKHERKIPLKSKKS